MKVINGEIQKYILLIKRKWTLKYKKNLPKKKVYSIEEQKKTVARVALLAGCVQQVIAPQINEATIRLLNRHGVEVVVLKGIDCCGSLNHHLGKSDLANKTFKKKYFSLV